MLGSANRCPHFVALRSIHLDPHLDFQRFVNGVACYVCDNSVLSKLWLCLHKDCLRVVCSYANTNHSYLHYKKDSSHCLHLNLATLRIWCYECDQEVVVSHGDLEVVTSPSALSHNDEPRPTGLTGLQNIGNTCYMNAALQALSNCPPLVQHFLTRAPPPASSATAAPPPPPPPPPSGDHATSSASAKHHQPCLTKSFHRLLLDIWSARRPSYIAPTAILYAIRKSHPMFRGFHQHDTQEFLRCLMDQLHEEMKVPNIEPPLYHPPCYHFLDTLEQISEGEGGAASSQSEGEEYETCDSGVSERSSLSEEATNNQSNANKPLRSMSRTPSPTGIEMGIFKNSMNPQSHIIGSPSRWKQISYRSIISDVFDGKLISSVQCLTCNRISTRVETFQDLSLPIPNRDHLNMLHHQRSVNTSPIKCNHLYPADQGWWAWLWDWVCSWFWGPTVGLHDCLSAFFSADELKGDNMYSCEKCNKLRNGVKYSRVLQCPEMLCVHLKRFRHELMFSSKIGNYVTFPLEGLDLKPYLHINCPSEVTTYNLTSVICHHGTAGGGHYTCYALNCTSGQWYEFDDQYVRQVSPETVTNCEAYVLFYRKDGSSVERCRRRAGRLQEMCSSAAAAAGSGSSSPPPVYYVVSHRWLDRFNCFAEPGPIDNRGLLCQHGLLAPDTETVLLAQPVWEYLHNKFKGGPVYRSDDLVPCDQCSDQSGETSLLRVQLNEFNRLQGSTNGGMYAIHGGWLSDWESYVRGFTTQPPGPIDNTAFANNTTSSVDDNFELTAGQWELLVKLYGGGPPVPIKESSESDSRSLDERSSNCDNLDSGCWVQGGGNGAALAQAAAAHATHDDRPSSECCTEPSHVHQATDEPDSVAPQQTNQQADCSE